MRTTKNRNKNDENQCNLDPQVRFWMHFGRLLERLGGVLEAKMGYLEASWDVLDERVVFTKETAPSFLRMKKTRGTQERITASPLGISIPYDDSICAATPSMHPSLSQQRFQTLVRNETPVVQSVYACFSVITAFMPRT